MCKSDFFFFVFAQSRADAAVQAQLLQLRGEHERLLAEHEAALKELAAMETRVVRGEFDPNNTKVMKHMGSAYACARVSVCASACGGGIARGMIQIIQR